MLTGGMSDISSDVENFRYEGDDITGKSIDEETRKEIDEMQMYRAAGTREGGGIGCGGGGMGGGCLNFRYFNRAAYSCNKSFLLGCL